VAFIVDVGMRMLDPETELAPAMGVPAGYVLGRDVSGRPVTKTDVTKMVGNMVSPPPAAALIKANCGDLPWWRNPIQQREAA
jgi:DNA (cytosine-5)-methyltransferase 1